MKRGVGRAFTVLAVLVLSLGLAASSISAAAERLSPEFYDGKQLDPHDLKYYSQAVEMIASEGMRSGISLSVPLLLADRLPMGRRCHANLRDYHRALYNSDREARAHGAQLTKARAAKVVAPATIAVRCEKCGKPFAPRSNRQKVCTACRSQVAKERNRERQRRKREAAA